GRKHILTTPGRARGPAASRPLVRRRGWRILSTLSTLSTVRRVDTRVTTAILAVAKVLFLDGPGAGRVAVWILSQLSHVTHLRSRISIAILAVSKVILFDRAGGQPPERPAGQGALSVRTARETS